MVQGRESVAVGGRGGRRGCSRINTFRPISPPPPSLSPSSGDALEKVRYQQRRRGEGKKIASLNTHQVVRPKCLCRLGGLQEVCGLTHQDTKYSFTIRITQWHTATIESRLLNYGLAPCAFALKSTKRICRHSSKSFRKSQIRRRRKEG